MTINTDDSPGLSRKGQPARPGPDTAGFVFAWTSLTPVFLLAAGAVFGDRWGGAWIWAALLYMAVLTYLLDELITAAAPADGVEFPAHDRLSVVLAVGHFAVLFLTVRALAGDALDPARKVALFLAAGLFMGQVSNSNAHELVHRGGRGLRRLGTWVYISLLFGHHASAHPLVHHVHVATDRDPNSARLGESYWRFLPRAWVGSFRAGMKAETARLARSRQKKLHPYAVYVGGGLAMLAVSALIAGPWGVAVHLWLAGYAQSQLLLSDYVQHYGLRRQIRADGRPEPVGPRHSWNAPHWMTGHMMLHAPRHSDHHAHPSRPYPALELPAPDVAPMLPRSLPAMATLALFPTLWRRVMDRRARRWQTTDLQTDHDPRTGDRAAPEPLA
ncbi:alkane 1-monooxygenase [Psychromarinibacter halotolerans]|uniref:Alkane 1-monooxygenase n=1 Tax=Psychromarinibacter halotolerans TaxID=1775175 RepID=A0ABV7GVP0_9RHOB|nr:alkane 1-monooxygenase [Psychromarinibacter halotolerans]MDF0594660.1 alkane 1-monooxygenase [Psychromarinibacter halotolerans]